MSKQTGEADNTATARCSEKYYEVSIIIIINSLGSSCNQTMGLRRGSSRMKDKRGIE